MWREGTIGIPNGDGTKTICHYWVKHYEEGSQFGINGGRISKLAIKVEGRITCNYDRGWDIEPTDEIKKKALAILVYAYK